MLISFSIPSFRTSIIIWYMVCYVAVSGFCKAQTNITFDAPCICGAFVTVTASGLLTTMDSHIIYCKRGKPKQSLNKEKKPPPPPGEKSPYIDIGFFRGGGERLCLLSCGRLCTRPSLFMGND